MLVDDYNYSIFFSFHYLSDIASDGGIFRLFGYAYKCSLLGCFPQALPGENLGDLIKFYSCFYGRILNFASEKKPGTRTVTL